MISPRDWAQVQELFREALERPDEERQALIRERAANSDVAREVESLLAAHPAASGFLSQSPLVEDMAGGTPRLAPHTRLGHFENPRTDWRRRHGRGVPRARHTPRPRGGD